MTEKFYFFEVTDKGETVYAGTMNQFFGLMAERGKWFNGSFVSEWDPCPSAVVEAPEEWEASGAALRLGDPSRDKLWAQTAAFAKKADPVPPY